MKSTVLTLRLYIFGVYAVLTHGANCGPNEYLSVAGECCPMCSKGSVVYRDCTGDYSTTCKPCTKGTFMNEPNGLNKCFSCKSCDTGLYILQECTTSEDTVCEVSDGYYCLQMSGGECSLASKHSDCEPGQQVKTPGTNTSDTVCEPCPPGFYSPKGVNCTKWTDCWDEIEYQEEGTSITDVQCKPRRTRYGVIAAILTLLILTVIVLYLWLREEIKCFTQLRSPVEETGLQASLCVPSSSTRVETDSPAVT
ncbi:hypothetical protein AMELA_G00263490 [Ameiurus melas]|uniref:TNFR-Cys domain-containing protein n=1 Tax=Ameiurus melas TaxID=219545 RepID=A0A7J5ZP93_AMEME|nr:hypothetical protein AMELA_G00263490 [Ameiurus melas]